VPDRVIGDPMRLRQIVFNLLGNAIKFTEHGEVELRIEAQAREAGHLELRLTVRDTGIGISPVQQETIFAPFAQADSSVTRKYGGTGLGLSICQRLASLLGGTIEVHSREGLGSTFRVAFPIEIDTGALSAPAVDTASPLTGTAILVLTPNDSLRRALCELLTDQGSTATGAAQIDGALPWLAATSDAHGRRHVAIIDCAARSVEADVAFSRLRSKFPVSAIVALVAAGDHDREERLRAQGVRWIVPKPAFEHALLPVVRSALAEPDARASAAEAVRRSAPDAALNVLIVEDNPINQLVAKRMLQQLGHRVSVAGNGVEALESVQRQRFDLVLMDIQMPELDGIEATRRIRGLAPNAHAQTPIFALTAHATRDDREECLAAGMDGFLSKPVRLADLVEAIERVQQLPAASRSAEAG
jgi:protein-histidine pros-kinase